MENNENLNKEKKIGLLRRLISNLHGAQIMQKINCLVLCAATVLTLNSCGDRNKNNTDKNNDTNISQNENQNNNQSGNQIGDQTNNQSGNQSGGQTGGNNTNNDQNNNNTGDNTNDNQNNDSSNNDYSEYSDLLQYVLTNEYYNSLIKSVQNGNTNLLETGYFQPHPYGFLEDEGYDIEEIKNSTDLAFSMSYIPKEDPEHLYVHTRILENDEYYTNYLIKYEITNDELSDYYSIQKSNKGVFFLQSAFMNDAISQIKEPTIVSKSKIRVDRYNDFLELIQRFLFNTSEKYGYIFANYKDAQTFDLIIYPRKYIYDSISHSNYIITLNCNITVNKPNPDIYDGPNNFIAVKIENSTKEEAMFFFPQDVELTSYNGCDFTQSSSNN